MTLDDRSLREHLDRRAEAGLTDVAQTADVVLARVAEIDHRPWWRRLGVRAPSLGIAAGAVAVLVIALAVLPPRLWPGPGSSPTSSAPAVATDYPANRALTAGELRTLLAGDTARLADAILIVDVELREATVSCPRLALCATFAIDFSNPASPIWVIDPHGVASVGDGTYAFHVLGESSVTVLGRVRSGPDGLAWTLPQLTTALPDLRAAFKAVSYLYLVDADRAISAAAISCPSVPGPPPSPDVGCAGPWTWLIENAAELPNAELVNTPPDGLRLPNAVDGRPGTVEHGYWLVDPLVDQTTCFACPPAGAADLVGRVLTLDELGLALAATPPPSTAPPTPTADASETSVREITFSTNSVTLDGFETADLTVTVSFADDVVPYFGEDASLTPLLHFQRDAGDTGDPLDPHIAQLVRTMRESPVAGLWTATFRLTSGDRGIWSVEGLVAYDADGRELYIGPAIRDLSPRLEVIGSSPPHLTMEVSPSTVEIGQPLEVSGQVTDQDTGGPLRDVVVTIGQGDVCNLGGTGATATTNPNGAYSYVIDEVVDPTVCAWISDEPGVHPHPQTDIPIALYGILFADQDGLR